MFASLIARSAHRGQPPSRSRLAAWRQALHLESLEDRRLPSSYGITVIAAVPTGYETYLEQPINSVNNAQLLQVAGGDSAHAYLWDSLHGTQDLGTSGTDNRSLAWALNDSGQVVGKSWTETWVPPQKKKEGYWKDTSLNAFLWTNAQGIQDLGSSNEANGINASGEVAGFHGSGAAVWNRSWHPIGTLAGGSGGAAHAINDYGQAAGAAGTSSGAVHAFLWTPSARGGTTGQMLDLGTLGGPNSSAIAIDSQGDVIGDADTSIGRTAFVWRPSVPNGTTGTMVDIDPGQGGLAKGINSSAFVVGASNNFGDGAMRAALWQPGTDGSYNAVDLNTLIPSNSGWFLSSAEAINNSGAIVVQGSSSTGTYSLLLTPSTALSQPMEAAPIVAAEVILTSTQNLWKAALASPSPPTTVSARESSPITKLNPSAVPGGTVRLPHATPKQPAAHDQVFAGELGFLSPGLNLSLGLHDLLPAAPIHFGESP
jgi:probable HAF family extracellular repeat protein